MKLELQVLDQCALVILAGMSRSASGETFIQKKANYMTATTIYPAAIARAVCALDEIQDLKSMPDGYIRILVRIIKKIDIRCPSRAIYASRATLADESGFAVATVHRCVRWLEDHGFLVRLQICNPGQRGSRSPLSPTAKLLDALMLSPEARAAVEAKKQAKPSPQKSGFERLQGLSVPLDLAWLHKEGGLRVTGILDLMKLAKSSKQRLSDVVAATAEYLRQHKGRSLYAYLRKLLTSGRDFGQAAKEQGEADTSEAKRELINRKSQELALRYFKNRTTGIVVQVADDGPWLFERFANGQYARRPVTVEFLVGISEGKWASHAP